MITETVRLGFNHDCLVRSLHFSARDKATVAYFLLCDSRKGVPRSGYLRAALDQDSQHDKPPVVGLAPGQVTDITSAAHHNQRQEHQKRVVVSEPKWRLGMNARGHPCALMSELYRALTSVPPVWTASLGMFGSPLWVTSLAMFVRSVTERKWCLGMNVRGHPCALMSELYRALTVSLGR
eukprot:gene31349-6505_t